LEEEWEENEGRKEGRGRRGERRKGVKMEPKRRGDEGLFINTIEKKTSKFRLSIGLTTF
jgi:hypothetical protein